jgi:hypothetical protein
MMADTIELRGLNKDQVDNAAAKAREEPRGSGEVLNADTGTEASPDAALLGGLQKALLDLGITDADQDAIGMLSYSACLTPDDAEPPISTTRLAGAVAVGQASTRAGSYAVALASVITKDPSILAVLPTDPGTLY